MTDSDSGTKEAPQFSFGGNSISFSQLKNSSNQTRPFWEAEEKKTELGELDAINDTKPSNSNIQLCRTESLTGEEEEESIFSNRGKLYISDANDWKERGTGSVKVNADGQGVRRLGILSC